MGKQRNLGFPVYLFKKRMTVEKYLLTNSSFNVIILSSCEKQ